MRSRDAIVFAALLLLSAGQARSAEPFAGIDPAWILLHEPAVIEELRFSKAKREEFQTLIDALDLRVFPLRNKPQEEVVQGLSRIAEEAKQGLSEILEPEQEQRLNEILMRRLGAGGLMREESVAKMRYSDEQRKQIEKILADTQAAIADLEKQASEGKPRGPLEKKSFALRTDEQKKILKLLQPKQQATWRELVGPKFDTNKLGQSAFKAPEIVDTGEWINSSPLRLDGLRGKVVAVHFYACGCINCIHNYPSYEQWHAAFKGKEFVLIGIHSPETESERDSAHVRSKAADAKLEFPILIDGKSENWNAWGNSMWPSVYLIDKRGYLRQFWPGELNWQGIAGEKHMRGWIEKLLAEPAP